MGHGVKLSELAEKMELKNLTPTVELKGKEVSIQVSLIILIQIVCRLSDTWNTRICRL